MRTQIRDIFDGGLRRAGALALTGWSAVLLPAGLGLVLYGVVERLESGAWREPLPIGVAVVAAGAIVWHLSRRLDASARAARARRDENRIVRLARERGGRLTTMEAAAETGLTAAEAEVILRGLAEGGFIEIEVTEAGIMVYRFPEVIYGSGGGRSWRTVAPFSPYT